MKLLLYYTTSTTLLMKDMNHPRYLLHHPREVQRRKKMENEGMADELKLIRNGMEAVAATLGKFNRLDLDME